MVDSAGLRIIGYALSMTTAIVAGLAAVSIAMNLT